MFYEGNKTQGWIRVATERYKLFQMFIWTVLLIISTSIKPANETPQVYGALTLFFIEPTGDIPFSDSSLPESVLYIQKKKKKKASVICKAFLPCQIHSGSRREMPHASISRGR